MTAVHLSYRQVNQWLRVLKYVASLVGVVLTALFILALIFSTRNVGPRTATTIPLGGTTSTQPLGRPVEVQGVTAGPDSVTLLVTVGECAANIEVSDEGTIIIQIFGPLPGDDTCEDRFTIRLHEPLGDRNVIDAFNGEVISVAVGD